MSLYFHTVFFANNPYSTNIYSYLQQPNNPIMSTLPSLPLQPFRMMLNRHKPMTTSIYKKFEDNRSCVVFLRDLPYIIDDRLLTDWVICILEAMDLRIFVQLSRVKYSMKQLTTLHVGMVLFDSEDEARQAMGALDGKRCYGRTIRASAFEISGQQFQDTQQIGDWYIRFSYPTSEILVTEETLLHYLKLAYGDNIIVDFLCIRGHYALGEIGQGQQNGYGFVTFRDRHVRAPCNMDFLGGFHMEIHSVRNEGDAFNMQIIPFSNQAA